MKKSLIKNAWMWPFFFVLVLYFIFGSLVFISLSGKWEIQELGQFGDSFGTLNSLFSGMGFAGLVVTIFVQQKQIKVQSEATQKQFKDTAEIKFEDTLFKLLHLYQCCLDEVIGKVETRTVTGRNALQSTTDHTLKLIRKNNVNVFPIEIKARFDANQLTNKDLAVIDYLCLKNFEIIHGIGRQGRLIQTLVVTLHHLENAPSHIDKNIYRALVSSQLTHVEIGYFFLIALGFNRESELRSLLHVSGLLDRMGASKQLHIHKYMYHRYWHYQIPTKEAIGGFPITASQQKKIRRLSKGLIDSNFSAKETELV